MDGKGRYPNNNLVKRLWRTMKYAEVYLKAYTGGRQAKANLDAYLRFYNTHGPIRPWATARRPRCSTDSGSNR